MPVVEMAFEPRPQILCQTHVIELLFSIKGIDTVSTPNVLLNYFLMLFQSITGDVFEMLADEVAHWVEALRNIDRDECHGVVAEDVHDFDGDDVSALLLVGV